ncbi:hypothetical protein T310_4067 [Rasamsonia emersonii CBS 393.64]|uniref:Telomerase activating protein Est1 n=1 Tax=Rasamsonia emersonii (strain ATCC 16479 / CBS 393.64 / IMI 116815) TaxID=1408163 RepID=A0A0F4YWA1_RASE3|nr:hypothetical protein T310_4067 [Rasamsonia emersonii CBS 393.64]KKA21903.1 hypothetical protein T310_4067 [Rasamsonia emersonii CBS 393.64]
MAAAFRDAWQFRVACQNAIFLDFEAACTENVEARLWDAHVKINNRFRKVLARFRDENGKKRPVEKRKLEKHYLDFIKSSQRFYRGYIQHLSSHFGGIPELEKVARKFNFENLSAEQPVNLDGDLRKRVLLSCHATLIRLGDLSRYRETELVSGKNRNWGPAIGYYDLASVINPDSGASHNQLAVIALADGNHLRATYHLYMALSAKDPHPTSKGNLEIEFRKIMNAWAKRELIPREDAGIPGKALTPWFVYLHAQCYKGVDFPEHDELENEVLSQLAVDLKERSLEGESTHNARVFFQRINVKTFFTLLQILLAELERFATEDTESKGSQTGPEKVTVVARRVLPALRHYSSWLLTNSAELVAQRQDKDTSLAVQIKEFWKIYANTLTLLASTFDVANLPDIEYLLEEDEETLGFKPLVNDATSRRYLDAKGQQKPRMLDPGVERNHPNLEMLYRIREFVIDGLDLVVNNRIPVALVDDNDRKMFIYQEEGLPSQFFTSPHGHHPTLSSTSIEREDIRHAQQNEKNSAETRSAFGGSQSASASMSANMNRIVEGVERLVESDTCEGASAGPELPEFLQDPPVSSGNALGPNSGSIPRNPGRQAPAVPPGLGLRNVSNPSASLNPSQSYTPRPTLPSIPSIWNTDFSSPAEAASSQTRPGAARQLSSSVLSPRPQSHFLAASSVDQSVPSQEPTASDIAFRNSLLLQRQQILEASSSASPFESSWTPPNPTPGYQYSAWDRDPFGSVPYYGTQSSQHRQTMSSSLGNASWADNAFIASSSLPSGSGFYGSSALNHGQKSAAQLGAIGQQTPPCGQEG